MKQLLSHQQKGTAIITALFIMTIVAIAATAMSIRVQIDIRRTMLTTNAEKLFHLAQGTQYWAISVLRNDVKNKNISQPQQARVDTLPQQFAQQKQDNALISGQLWDAQSRFNINNLSQVKYFLAFQRLLTAVVPTLSQQQTQTITLAISDWVNLRKSAISSQFDKVYSKANPPYQAAHQFMASISELRLIAGINAKLYQQLQPYLIALPQVTPININTATAPILISLGFNAQQAAQIISARTETHGFINMQAFQKIISQLQQNDDTQRTYSNDDITLNSEYFINQAYAVLPQQAQSVIITTLLHRYTVQNKMKVAIIWQSQGL